MRTESLTHPRILLLEDDRSLGETLTERLRKEGFIVEWSETIASVRLEDLPNRFDLLILDIGLPDGDGIEVAKRAREIGDTPVIFLTARSTAEDRLRAYELGAEEFIPKPFHLRELFLRIEHVLANHAKSSKVAIGNVVVDFAALSVNRGAAVEKLNVKEASVLKILIDRSPKVVSRDELLDRVWGENEYPSNRTVDNVIVRLRQALGSAGGSRIVSVRGIGYQLLNMDQAKNGAAKEGAS